MSYSYHFRRILTISFAILYLTNYFLHSPSLSALTSILLILVVALAFPELPKTNFKVSAGLVLLGCAILIIKGVPLQGWLQAASKNAGLATLFLTVPLMGLPLSYENYQEELKHVAQKHMTHVWTFLLLTAVVAHILGVIISLGAVALVYELFRENARLYKAERLFIAALLQGYMTSGFWSPGWASIALITHNLRLPWLSLVPVGVALTVAALAISLFWLYLQIKQRPDRYPPLNPDNAVAVNWSYIYTILVLAAALIFAIILFNLFTAWETLVIIPVVAAVFPLAAGLAQRKMPQYKKGMLNYYDKTLIKVKSEVVLFAAAGFLGKALELSGVSRVIPELLPAWFSQSAFLTILGLMLIMIVISLSGIHPVVTGSALVGALNPASLGLSPFIFALTIIGGWAISIMVSPFSAANLIVSGLSGKASWEIGLRINGPFGLLILLTLALGIRLLMAA